MKKFIICYAQCIECCKTVKMLLLYFILYNKPQTSAVSSISISILSMIHDTVMDSMWLCHMEDVGRLLGGGEVMS